MAKRTKECAVDGCNSPVHGRGWCSRHYSAWRHRGNPTAAVDRHYSSPAEALKARTVGQGDCLVWTGYTTNLGYGMLSVGNRLVMVHRFAWESASGEQIPDGYEVDHTCWNRACCNTDHLRLVTRHQNMRNRNGAMSTSRTGVRNVRAAGESYWVVVNGETVGTFTNLAEAQAAAEQARKAKFGDYAGRG